MYVLLFVWYVVPWSIEDGGPPPLWVLPWAGIALAAFAWLWVWWLDYADRRNPKHAITFIAAFVVLLASNGAAGIAVTWTRTQGFGFAGHPSVEEALDAFIASTCLFGKDLYRNGGKLVSPTAQPIWAADPPSNWTTRLRATSRRTLSNAGTSTISSSAICRTLITARPK